MPNGFRGLMDVRVPQETGGLYGGMQDIGTALGAFAREKLQRERTMADALELARQKALIEQEVQEQDPLYQLLRQRPIPLQLSLERYMKCGVGICGHCIIDDQGRRVCREGPVFEAQTLENTDFGLWARDGTGKRVSHSKTAICPR